MCQFTILPELYNLSKQEGLLKLYVNHGRTALAQIETCKVGAECRVNKMEPGLDYDMYKDDNYSMVFIFENLGPEPTTVSTVYTNLKSNAGSIISDTQGAMALGATSLAIAAAAAFLF